MGGALQAIVDRHLGDPFFGIFLNPGHQLHLDEWVNSPVYAGSTIELRSGMALQCDIIPATGTPYFTTNIEDGLALADESLRAAFASSYPEAWARIEARRTFMIDTLGIDLHPDVLPFSNLAAHLPPFLLVPEPGNDDGQLTSFLARARSNWAAFGPNGDLGGLRCGFRTERRPDRTMDRRPPSLGHGSLGSSGRST